MTYIAMAIARKVSTVFLAIVQKEFIVSLPWSKKFHCESLQRQGGKKRKTNREKTKSIQTPSWQMWQMWKMWQRNLPILFFYRKNFRGPIPPCHICHICHI
jgi:hypothetical protein